MLEKLGEEDIEAILNQAMERMSAFAKPSDAAPMPTPPAHDQADQQPLTAKLKETIVSLAAGDARIALSLLELVLNCPKDVPESSLLRSLRQSVSSSYDRTGESHYDMISALHKSVRGSQPDAALYWLARMLCEGEDPMYIARRLVVCSSEDIGLADPHALPLVSDCSISGCATHPFL